MKSATLLSAFEKATRKETSLNKSIFDEVVYHKKLFKTVFVTAIRSRQSTRFKAELMRRLANYNQCLNALECISKQSSGIIGSTNKVDCMASLAQLVLPKINQ